MGLIKEEAEVGEHHPKLLPSIAVLEFPQEVARELVLYIREVRKRGGRGMSRFNNTLYNLLCIFNKTLVWIIVDLEHLIRTGICVTHF